MGSYHRRVHLLLHLDPLQHLLQRRQRHVAAQRLNVCNPSFTSLHGYINLRQLKSYCGQLAVRVIDAGKRLLNARRGHVERSNVRQHCHPFMLRDAVRRRWGLV